MWSEGSAAKAGGKPPPLSYPEEFLRIRRQWSAWQRGIVPSRELKGYGGQNPWLMEAFAALDRAQDRARRHFEQNPPKR